MQTWLELHSEEAQLVIAQRHRRYDQAVREAQPWWQIVAQDRQARERQHEATQYRALQHPTHRSRSRVGAQDQQNRQLQEHPAQQLPEARGGAGSKERQEVKREQDQEVLTTATTSTTETAQQQSDGSTGDVSDEELACALSSLVHSDTQQRGCGEGGGRVLALSCGQNDYIRVECQAPPRKFVALMDPRATLKDLAIAAALAMKWHTSEIRLDEMGSTRTVPLGGRVGDMEPPHKYDLRRIVPLHLHKYQPISGKAMVEIDLGIIQPQAHYGREGPDPTTDLDKHDSSDGPGICSASSSTQPPGPRSDEECMMMRQHDYDAKNIVVRRQKRRDTHTFHGSMTADDLMSTYARAKRLRRDGFTLYRALKPEETLEDGLEYYMHWETHARGGSTPSVCTTLTYTPTSHSEACWDMKDARSHLQKVEDLIHRINQANQYLVCFGTITSSRRVLSLGEVTERWALQARGGMHRAEEHVTRLSHEPAKWESKQSTKGLIMVTDLSVKIGEGQHQNLESLPADTFAEGATGYSLLAWETWEQVAKIRSPKPLIAILPGRRKQQMTEQHGLPADIIRESEVVMRHPDNPSEDKQFIKGVTIVNHTAEDQKCLFDLKHQGREIAIKPAFAHLVLVDLYQDMAANTQQWDNASIRLTLESAVTGWGVTKDFAWQWPTLKYFKEQGRASVMIRATADARMALLKNSGVSSIFTRERVEQGTKTEYVVVWHLPNSSAQGKPLGIVSAHAKAFQHWGIVRNQKSVGLRVLTQDVAKARAALRPSDSVLNESNRQLAPTSLWVLKGVLPVRKQKAVWLIEADSSPPSYVMYASEMIILVEKHDDNRGRRKKPGHAQTGRSTHEESGRSSQGRDHNERRGEGVRALSTSRAHQKDPLGEVDPWAGWKQRDGVGNRPAATSTYSKSPTQPSSSSHQSDPAVLSRLKRAEDAIERIEQKQQQTDVTLGTMQSFMGQRFEEVLAKLSDLQGEPKRKAREDGRGGNAEAWISANVTSFGRHWQEVIDLPGPVIGVTETLLRDTDRDWVTGALAARKKKIIMGAQAVQTGSLNARKAGVALIIDDAYAAQALPLPKSLKRPFEEARALCASVSCRAARKAVRLIVFYGKAGAYAANANEVAQILDELAESPDKPTMLMGDLNLPDTHVFWEGFRCQNGWHDVHSCVGQSSLPGPTCWPSNGNPTRIDFVIVNTMLMASVRGAHRIENTTLPVHIPISVDILQDLEPLEVLRLPTQIPVEAPLPTVFDQDFLITQQAFQDLLIRGELEQAYLMWSCYWEERLICHAFGNAGTARYKGRGRVPEVVRIFPRSPKTSALSDLEAHLTKVLGRIREYRRMVDTQTVTARQLAEKIRRNVEVLMALDPQPHPVPLKPTSCLLWIPMFRNLGARKLLVPRRQRQAQWRAKLSARHALDKSVSQKIKGTSGQILRTIVPKDQPSSPILATQQIFEALDEVWDAIHMKPETADDGALDAFLEAIPEIPEPVLEPITGGQVRARLAKMKKHSARGPDGWALSELRALPPEAHTQLAMFYMACEHWTAWPPVLLLVHTTVLQKGETPSPLDVRPIGITPITYRLWSGIRFASLGEWMVLACPRELTAYKQGVDTQKINLQRACRIEEALVKDEELHLLSFDDLTKAFDHVPHSFLERVCERTRLPPQIRGLLRARLRGQVQHWKISGALSRPRKYTRGLIQGCALSCLYFNLIMSPLAWYLRSSLEPVTPIEIHADDLFLISESVCRIQNTYRTMSRYLGLLGVPLQPTKTQYLKANARNYEPLVLEGGCVVEPMDQIKVLGQSMTVVVPLQGTVMHVTRMEKYLQRTRVIAELGLPPRMKLRALQMMGLSVLDFCPWQVLPLRLDPACRKAALDVLFPRMPSHRAGEILLHLFTPGHVADPGWVLLYRLLNHVSEYNRQVLEQGGRVRLPLIACRTGPCAVLIESLQELGFQVKEDGRVRDGEGQSLSLVSPKEPRSKKLWLHQWRRAFRMCVFSELAIRRPSEFEGIQLGVDRNMTKLLYDAVSNRRWRYHLRMVASGAQITGEVRYRNKTAEDSRCPWCAQECETLEHRMWLCEKWNQDRERWLEGVPFRNLPRLMTLTGIVPEGFGGCREWILRVQALLLTISIKATLGTCLDTQMEHEQDAVPTLDNLPGWLAADNVKKCMSNPQREPMQIDLTFDDDDGDNNDGDGDRHNGGDDYVMKMTGHQITRTEELGAVCVVCGLKYSRPYMWKFAHTQCNGGEGPKPRPCPPPTSSKVMFLWMVPRHASRPHEFDPPTPWKNITCRLCRGTWLWGQRYQLSRSKCLGSPDAEQERRRLLDESLPLTRRGHVPGMHPTINIVHCITCGYQTRGETVRGFDRSFCRLATGSLLHRFQHQVRNARRRTRFVGCLDGRGLPVAKCIGCTFTSPWRSRQHAFKRHLCR